MSAVSARGWMSQRQNSRKVLAKEREEWSFASPKIMLCSHFSNVIIIGMGFSLRFSNDIWILNMFHVSHKKVLWLCHNGGPVVTAILCWDLALASMQTDYKTAEIIRNAYIVYSGGIYRAEQCGHSSANSYQSHELKVTIPIILMDGIVLVSTVRAVQ